MSKIKKVCAKCGCSAINFNGPIYWHVEKQRYVVGGVSKIGHECYDCGATLTEADIRETEERPEASEDYQKGFTDGYGAGLEKGNEIWNKALKELNA